MASLSPGSYELWTRACLGQTCGARQVPVRIGPAPTALQFTERSMRAGQHSDVAVVEALLSDEAGAPLAHAPVTFELAGPAGMRTVDARTDPQGLAVAALTLEEQPGEHRLTVRYDGADDRAGSSATTGFQVEHEETALDLGLHGKGAKRVLTAELRDHDAAHGVPGIAGKTVTFTAEGRPLGEAVTDQQGVARFSPPPSAKGPFRATFTGDSWFTASSGTAG